MVPIFRKFASTILPSRGKFFSKDAPVGDVASLVGVRVRPRLHAASAHPARSSVSASTGAIDFGPVNQSPCKEPGVILVVQAASRRATTSFAVRPAAGLAGQASVVHAPGAPPKPPTKQAARAMNARGETCARKPLMDNKLRICGRPAIRPAPPRRDAGLSLRAGPSESRSLSPKPTL